MRNLHIRNLSKTYPNGVRALHNVSLNIPVGMFGLLGPNGAGKSTLMRILATLQDPDEGKVDLGGIDVVRQKDEVRKTLGYLPQDFGFYRDATAKRLLEQDVYFCVMAGRGQRGANRQQLAAVGS
ncbi:MAG TPA: ATP-binding cassette domain-containing protein [Thermoanaerobaculia bacterium]|nr:ATP-binding cassette domain-containing protein [Thermoanaerobaculia bacterium]